MKKQINLEDKLETYYDSIRNPKYKLGKWIITDNKLYIKLKNKLNISYISSINVYLNESIAIVESKDKYIAIKYTPKYICYMDSDTEYGLSSDEYDMLAVNQEVLNPDLELSLEPIPLQQISKLFNWKISKVAKQSLDYFV
jgi:hypothetical protein